MTTTTTTEPTEHDVPESTPAPPGPSAGERAADPVAPSAFDRFAPLVAGVLLALPSVVARYLPMSDLPLHEGVVGLLRHFDDPAYMPVGLYERNFGHPNQLFHVSAWLLSYLVPTDWAVKLVVAAAQVLIFAAGVRLADHLGRSRWGVVLLAPLALGFTYYWGLVANLVGFAAFIYALPTIDRGAADPTPRNALATCGVLVLLFYAHESACASAAAVVCFFALLYPLRLRATLLRFAPAAFAAAGAKAHLVWQSRIFTSERAQPPATFFPLSQRLHNLPNVLFGSHEMAALLMLFGLSVVAIAGLVASRVREERRGPRAARAADSGRLDAVRAFLHRYRFEAVGTFFLLLYLTLPFNWKGATLIHERFLGPAWAIFVVCAAPRGPVVRVAKLAASVVPVAILLLAWPQFQDADSTFRNLDAVIAKIPKNRAVTLVALDRPIHHIRVYSAMVGPARELAVNGGRMGLALAYSPIAPVRIRPEYRWNNYDLRMIVYGSRALAPASDLTKFEYVIGASREPETREFLKIAFRPDAEFVMEQGEWMLFRSTHAIDPLKSPETLPPAHAQTILDRVVKLARHRFPAPAPDAPTIEGPDR